MPPMERKPDAKSLRLAAKGLYFSPGQVRSRLHSMVPAIRMFLCNLQIAIISVLLWSPQLKASLPLVACPTALRVQRCARHCIGVILWTGVLPLPHRRCYP